MTSLARFFRVAGVIASSAFVMALPTFVHAATYAFVNQSAEVSIVNADDPMTAIATAYRIDAHSGVILLKSQADYAIVGKSVSGM